MVWCGLGEPVDCLVEGEIGRLVCDACADGGIHKCEKPRHRPSPQPSECPRFPSHVTRCPRGKSTIAPSSSVERSQHTFAATQIPSPLAPPLVRHPNIVCSRPCQAKCHTRPHHAQSRSRARADVGERRAVFLAAKSATAVLVTTQQKRARSSPIARARLSALVVGCVVSLRLWLLPQSRRERNALGQGRKMEMGLGLGKSRG